MRPAKPSWLLRKERHRAEARANRTGAATREVQRQRLHLLFRIKDVCWDIDVWRDQKPGTEFDAFNERAGVQPSLDLLQREYAQLLRIASLRGADVAALNEETTAA